MDTFYQHSPVQDCEIRLLDLDYADASYDAPLHGRLRTVHLAIAAELKSTNDYMTISHAWGPTCSEGSHLTRCIFLDSKPHRITQSLYDCLSRLRQQFRSSDPSVSLASRIVARSIWVDAICISQTDIAEKSAQVRLMGTIFERCSLLVVWLGEPANAQERDSVRDLRTWSFQEGKYGPNAHIFKALVDSLMQRLWFRRRWIIQEYRLSERKLFLLGDTAFTCTMIHIAYRTDELLTGSIFDCHLPGHTPKTPQAFSTLLEETARNHTFDCSVDHDRLFALASLGSDKAAVNIDYKQPIESLYRDFAIHNARLSLGSFLLLLEVGLKLRNPSWPSWIPDFRARTPMSREPFALYTNVQTWKELQSPCLAICDNLLRVQGRLLEKQQVVHVWTGIGRPSRTEQRLENAVAKLASNERLAIFPHPGMMRLVGDTKHERDDRVRAVARVTKSPAQHEDQPVYELKAYYGQVDSCPMEEWPPEQEFWLA